MKAWLPRRISFALLALALALLLTADGRAQPDEPAPPADGTYVLEVTPSLGIPATSEQAWALFRDDRLASIVFCRAERIALGRIFFPQGNYLSGEWQLKSDYPTVGGSLMVHRDEGRGRPYAVLDLGGEDLATLTMRGRQGDYVEGMIAGEGSGVTEGGDSQPVTV